MTPFEDSKVNLSQYELELVSNASVLLTKNKIIEKVYGLFGEIADEQRAAVQLLPQEISMYPPKISRGEKYQGLPYVMLDYPRCFGKEDVFAVRTFFWWGHFVSVSLHLKGIYQQQYLPRIHAKKNLLESSGLLVAIGGDEWDHDLQPENFKLASAYCEQEKVSELIQKPFYKLSARADFGRWNEFGRLLNSFHQLFYRLIEA